MVGSLCSIPRKERELGRKTRDYSWDFPAKLVRLISHCVMRPTGKQIAFLNFLGYEDASTYTKDQAHDLITQPSNRTTVRYRNVARSGLALASLYTRSFTRTSKN
jgi:hypothetical protein